jgi:hypothetical protein
MVSPLGTGNWDVVIQDYDAALAAAGPSRIILEAARSTG